MTELLIVSKPRGRIHKWIYGQYKEYLSSVSFGRWQPQTTTIDATGDKNDLDYDRYQRFKTPSGSPLYLRRVKLWLRKLSSSSSTITIELRSDDGGVPGSKIADIGSVVIDDLPFDFSTPISLDCEIEVQPDTYYFIKVPDVGAVGLVHWEMSTTDVYADGYAYDHSGSHNYDFHMALVYTNFSGDGLEKGLDFIYDGAAEKRLEISFTYSIGLSEILVNGESKGTSLAKEDSIPQADNYTITFKVSDVENYDLQGSIQRWLYYNKTSITLDDLNVSEAYIQEIEYGADGGVLRIDDDPAGDLVGSANETLQFTNILVPFRKLEWISGGGEVLILGVE